jgi:hypothetical protein
MTTALPKINESLDPFRTAARQASDKLRRAERRTSQSGARSLNIFSRHCSRSCVAGEALGGWVGDTVRDEHVRRAERSVVLVDTT